MQRADAIGNALTERPETTKATARVAWSSTSWWAVQGSNL
ncbi:hypothetical protein XCR_1225 [Xanthomonas campestris pv. raphani 756C]|nr:hypothetical protein XCR_1225 [Xanthomonas campestris pv. raphani 756C]